MFTQANGLDAATALMEQPSAGDAPPRVDFFAGEGILQLTLAAMRAHGKVLDVQAKAMVRWGWTLMMRWSS
jgi:hypothetical protein